MFELMLGISTGFFMAAFINKRYNKSQWIATKYLIGLGVVSLIICTVLYF